MIDFFTYKHSRLSYPFTPSRRFEWFSVPNLVFHPSVGHLHAGKRLAIRVRFVADSKVCLNPENVALKAQEISYSGAPVEWDDTRKETDDEEAVEPEHDVVAGSLFERNLEVE